LIASNLRKGLSPREFPYVGGQEGGGVVASTTPKAEADGVKVGDRVAYSVFGSYAEYTAVPSGKLLPVPDEVGMDVATCLPVQVSKSEAASRAENRRAVLRIACCLF
jgi:NADPH2:quinone reductase